MFTRELQGIKINHIAVARITNTTDGYCIQYISPIDQHLTFIFTSNIAMLLLRECKARGYTRLSKKKCLVPLLVLSH